MMSIGLKVLYWGIVKCQSIMLVYDLSSLDER
jgi:hypothetical protein